MRAQTAGAQLRFAVILAALVTSSASHATPEPQYVIEIAVWVPGGGSDLTHLYGSGRMTVYKDGSSGACVPPFGEIHPVPGACPSVRNRPLLNWRVDRKSMKRAFQMAAASWAAACTDTPISSRDEMETFVTIYRSDDGASWSARTVHANTHARIAQRGDTAALISWIGALRNQLPLEWERGNRAGPRRA